MILIAKVLIYLLLIFTVIFSIPLLYTRKRTPKLSKSNIAQIGKKCQELMQLKHLAIDFKLEKKIKHSHVKVIKKGKKYIVFIKDDWFSYHASVIIHELTHIKTGQSDKVKDLLNNCRGYFMFLFLWIYFDFCFAFPNEVRYLQRVRKSCK